LEADLSRPDEVVAVIPGALEALGGLDILINNAGILFRHFAADYPADDYRTTMAVNLDAVFTLSQAAGRHMLAQSNGKIINIASMNSFVGGQRVIAYAISKAGVAQLTRALADEWAGKGVHVNAIAPGYMHTELTEGLLTDESRAPAFLARVPAGRWGEADDLKGAVLFLASAASDYVHGTILRVDGGYLAR
jgi:2-deoxy-D-gluconate 3-dehydrogenase